MPVVMCMSLAPFSTIALRSWCRLIPGPADCVIAFGASLNRFTTSEGWLVDWRRLVQVDDDLESLGRYVAPDAGVDIRT